MTTVEFITALFYEVDEQLRAIPKHPKAHLWPSEVVTLGLPAGAQRRRQPGLLSVADARLSRPVPPPPQVDAALSPLHDPSRLAAGFLGRPDGARRHRHIRDRAAPSDARRPQSPADGPQRPLESPLDCWRATLSPAQLMGVDHRVGV